MFMTRMVKGRSRRPRARLRLLACLAALVVAMLAVSPARPAGLAAAGAEAGAEADEPQAGRWSAVWASAVQPANTGKPWLGPNWSQDGFTDESIRQTVRTSAGGAQVRVRLSNLYGRSLLRITGASIARSGGGAAVQPGTVHRLTFGHRRSATIPGRRAAGVGRRAVADGPAGAPDGHPARGRGHRSRHVPRARPHHQLSGTG